MQAKAKARAKAQAKAHDLKEAKRALREKNVSRSTSSAIAFWLINTKLQEAEAAKVSHPATQTLSLINMSCRSRLKLRRKFRLKL